MYLEKINIVSTFLNAKFNFNISAFYFIKNEQNNLIFVFSDGSCKQKIIIDFYVFETLYNFLKK